MYPLPRYEWHWRWPKDIPCPGLETVKNLLREIVFKKYWELVAIPVLPDL